MSATERILHEAATDPLLHVIRLNEQSVELVNLPMPRDDGRERGRPAVGAGDNAHPPGVDELLGELEHVGMSGELLAVLLPDGGRPALERLERSTPTTQGISQPQTGGQKRSGPAARGLLDERSQAPGQGRRWGPPTAAPGAAPMH